jgi:hypothetical protein
MTVRLSKDTVGQKFVRRNGEVVEHILFEPRAERPALLLCSEAVCAYSADGAYRNDGGESQIDIVSPWLEPQTFDGWYVICRDDDLTAAGPFPTRDAATDFAYQCGDRYHAVHIVKAIAEQPTLRGEK